MFTLDNLNNSCTPFALYIYNKLSVHFYIYKISNAVFFREFSVLYTTVAIIFEMLAFRLLILGGIWSRITQGQTLKVTVLDNLSTVTNLSPLFSITPVPVSSTPSSIQFSTTLFTGSDSQFPSSLSSAFTGIPTSEWSSTMDSSAIATPLTTSIIAATTVQSVSTMTMSSSTILANHFVDVGAQGRFLFNPIQVDAAVGDVIMFRFLALNHTVTQSSLEKPCVPNGGFDSGFQYYNPYNQTGIVNNFLPFLVRDTEPVWFFCRQAVPQSHCNTGMVFGINTGNHNTSCFCRTPNRP